MQSVKHHEQGRKHKDKVAETLKAKRQAKSDASAAQRELQDQLRQIEEAAQAKYAQDMAGRRPPPPPRHAGPRVAPPPPPRPGRNGTAPTPSHTAAMPAPPVRPQSGEPSAGQRYVEQDEEPEEDEDDNGVYAVKGVVYLEGKKHENQLETGSACQIWVEAAEQWLDALLEKATVHTIPNTELSFRRFTVMYMLPATAEGEKPRPMTETEVKSDRLRIALPSNVTLEAAEKMVEQWRAGGDASASAAPAVPIDETTGMGEWSTVEVRQIDESPEAVAQRAAEAEAEAARIEEEQKRMDALEDFSSQGDNALGAFNPWGGSYKGVNIDDAAEGSAVSAPAHSYDEIHITTKGTVGFKKRERKAKAGGDKKRRRIHTDD